MKMSHVCLPYPREDLVYLICPLGGADAWDILEQGLLLDWWKTSDYEWSLEGRTGQLERLLAEVSHGSDCAFPRPKTKVLKIGFVASVFGLKCLFNKTRILHDVKYFLLQFYK